MPRMQLIVSFVKIISSGLARSSVLALRIALLYTLN